MKNVLSKNHQGFTLVELMVVVAIIGILSAVAVPNFRRYQSKSKQSEAKVQLAAIYNAEQASLSDYDTYANCISALGVERPQRAYYAIGFNADAAGPRTQVVARGNTNCLATDFGFMPVTLLEGMAGQPNITVGGLTSTSATVTTFTAAAAGQISTTTTVAVGGYDRWTIDQNKTIINTVQSL